MRESTLRELTLRLKNAAPTLQLEENADMARYTTLHLGGPADAPRLGDVVKAS